MYESRIVKEKNNPIHLGDNEHNVNENYYNNNENENIENDIINNSYNITSNNNGNKFII